MNSNFASREVDADIKLRKCNSISVTDENKPNVLPLPLLRPLTPLCSSVAATLRFYSIYSNNNGMERDGNGRARTQTSEET